MARSNVARREHRRETVKYTAALAGRPGRERVAYGAMRVLVLNPGSSSLKSSVIETATVPAPDARGIVARCDAECLTPLGQIDLDWGVDATSGGDPADDIRELIGRVRGRGYRGRLAGRRSAIASSTAERSSASRFG